MQDEPLKTLVMSQRFWINDTPLFCNQNVHKNNYPLCLFTFIDMYC